MNDRPSLARHRLSLQIFRSIRGTETSRSIGIVGLGVAALAGYAEAGQDFTYYEIDPAIAQVAQNPQYFTFLRDAEERGARMRVLLGDARLKLRESNEGAFGVLILDAFTSDCIPV